MTTNREQDILIKSILEKQHSGQIIGKASLSCYIEQPSGYFPTTIMNLVEEKATSDLRKIEEGLALIEEYKKLGVTIFDSKMLWLLNKK